MNLALFRSWHALFAALIACGFAGWLLLESFHPGARAGAQRIYLLASGWTALCLYAVVFLYVLRKYAHKLAISPEFGMKVSIAALERADRRIAALRRQVLAGTMTDKSQIRARAREALREEGVQHVRRVVIARAYDNPAAPWQVELEPTYPLGQMFRWMHSHLYYGVAAAAVVVLHGGPAPASLLGILLVVFSAIVIVTGLIGIVCWVFGPAWLTSREQDLNIEKAFALNESLTGKVERAYELVDPQMLPIFRDVDRRGGGFHERARRAMESLAARPEGGAKYADFLALLGQRHEVKKELTALMRIRFLLNIWRAVHIPAAIVLALLVAVHVGAVLWY